MIQKVHYQRRDKKNPDTLIKTCDNPGAVHTFDINKVTCKKCLKTYKRNNI